MNITFENEGVSKLVKGMCVLRHRCEYLYIIDTIRRHELMEDLKACGIDATRPCAKKITDVLLLLPNTYRVSVTFSGIGVPKLVNHREIIFDCETKATILDTYLRLYDIHYRFMYKAILDIAGWYVEINRRGIGSRQMYSNGHFALRYPRLYKKINGDFMKLYEHQRKLID